MATGWIKLDRKLLDNEIWNVKPFSWGQAWVDLLLLANHADHVAIIRSNAIECKRGEVNRSQKQLAERWGWSRNKVRKFLDTLEELEMVTTESTAKGTTLTIEKYSVFQNPRATESTTEGTTQGHPKDTYKNDKNVKEGEEVARAREDDTETGIPVAAFITQPNDTDAPRYSYPTLKEISLYCSEHDLNVDVQRFARYYESNGWKTKNGKPVTNWKQKLHDWDAADRPSPEEEKAKRERIERGRQEQAEREAKLEAEYMREFEKRKNSLFKVIK